MTQETTSNFEAFSEMLDQEENLEIVMAEDAYLLLELRDVLRTEAEGIHLPSNFADETAKVVRERYGTLSLLDRLMNESRSHLLGNAFGSSNLWKSAALIVGGAGLAFLDWNYLTGFGVLLGILAGLWLLRERKTNDYLGSTSGGKARPSNVTNFVTAFFFYLMPVMAVLGTGYLAASGIASLALMTLSFRDSTGTLAWFSMVVGIGTVVLLFKAFSPVWRAYRARSASHLGGLIGFQVFYSLWLAALAFVWPAILGEMSDSEFVPYFNWGLAGLASFCCLAVVVVYGSSEVPREIPSLSRARKVFWSSFLLGFGPIMLALFAFYQLHLTREIVDPSYTHLLEDGQNWAKAQQSIPPEENGWIELRPYFVKGSQELPENKQVAQSFKALSEFYLHDADSYAQLSPAQRGAFESKKSEFLAVLPRIERALEKPHFSHIATEGFSFESLAPNFITYRAVSQGLALLSQEALAQGEVDRAIEQTDLAVQWARKEEPAMLIQLMIQIAQLSISYEGLEQTVLSGRLKDEQLERLSKTLERARFSPKVFADTMKRESTMTDQALQKLLIDKRARPEELDAIGMPNILAYFPQSFWESERKAYWNDQLTRTLNWHNLSYQDADQSLELNPLNVASATFLPHIGRPRARFCYLHSKYSSLMVQCQLERYKLKYGRYPEKLEQLTPEFLNELPVDMMDPKPLSKKGGFQYRLIPEGYLLLSESPMYPQIRLKSMQSYGHDGDFQERRL